MVKRGGYVKLQVVRPFVNNSSEDSARKPREMSSTSYIKMHCLTCHRPAIDLPWHPSLFSCICLVVPSLPVYA